MRCFIAVDLPKEIQKYLSEIQGKLPRDPEESRLLDVAPEILHLTLKFFGEIDDKQLEKIKNVMKRISFNKFKARLDTIGIFSKDFVRIIWVSLEPKDEFKKIHDVIDKILYLEGFEMDKRFEAHTTLSRVKWLKDKKGFIEKVNGINLNPLEFTVDSIKLKKSVLTEKGPIYEDIVKIDLY